MAWRITAAASPSRVVLRAAPSRRTNGLRTWLASLRSLVAADVHAIKNADGLQALGGSARLCELNSLDLEQTSAPARMHAPKVARPVHALQRPSASARCNCGVPDSGLRSLAAIRGAWLRRVCGSGALRSSAVTPCQRLQRGFGAADDVPADPDALRLLV